MTRKDLRQAEDRFGVVTTDRVTTAGKLELDPGADRDGRAEVLCGECGEPIRYPHGEWGEVACGCEEPPEWVIT